VTPEARERVLEEEGLETLRRASGAPTRRPPSVYGPLGTGARIGFGLHWLQLPLQGTGASELSLSSPGVFLGSEFRLLGPVTLDVWGFRGIPDGVDGGTESIGPSGSGGTVTALAALIGFRGSAGSSLSWAVHAGSMQEVVTFPGGDTPSLTLGGAIGQARLDLRLSGPWYAGIALSMAQLEADGQFVDRLKEEGVQPGTATMQTLALTWGARF